MKGTDRKFAIEPPKPKAGKWVRLMDLGTKWNALWSYKCGSTGFVANIRFLGSSPRPLEKILVKPFQVQHNHTVDIMIEDSRTVVAKWRPSDGRLTVMNSLLTKRAKDGKSLSLDTVIRAGYGLKQAMRMAYLILAEEGVIDINGKVKSKP